MFLYESLSDGEFVPQLKRINASSNSC